MADWESLWRLVPDGLMLDDNGDGFVDGTAACIVPLSAERLPAVVWAACANLAVRIGLETPALRLPIAVSPDQIEPWQIPIFVGTARFPGALHEPEWSGADMRVLDQSDTGVVAWLDLDDRRALWIHAGDVATLAEMLNSMAAAGAGDDLVGGTSLAPQREPAPLDLARLFTTEPGGLYTPGPDGFIPHDTALRLQLDPEIGAPEGYAAIDLAARIGLETTGATLPLVSVASGNSGPDVGGVVFSLGAVDEAGDTPRLVAEHDDAQLTASTATYLATAYPYLTQAAQRAGTESETLSALMAGVRHIANGHPPAMKLALAQVQAQAVGSSNWAPIGDASQPLRQVFRLEWNPPDGEDNVSRVKRLAHETILPELVRELGQPDPASQTPACLTVFCSAPLAARRCLQAEIEGALADASIQVEMRVLPVHKAALAWVREEQIPLLAQMDVASVDLVFREFLPQDPNAKWLDLPTRWLQAWFPVKDIVQHSLGLATDQVHLRMARADEVPAGDGAMLPAYRVVAYDGSGKPVHEAELFTLADEREYLTGFPERGLVHPLTAGAILGRACRPPRTWVTTTDEGQFWDFYQQTVLPAVYAHVLDVSGGHPTPDNEPYFERLEVEGAFGWPDEELGVAREFVSVGEALHEDIYFNTLDYLAAVGERHCGRPIVAAGNVIPLIHDCLDTDGSVLSHGRPRAVVTLIAWPVPIRLRDTGIVTGDVRDLSKLEGIRIGEMELDERGGSARRVVVELQYASKYAARFAANVFDRLQTLDGVAGLPCGVDVVLLCKAGPEEAGQVLIDGQRSKGWGTPEEAPPVESAVIGPPQLEDRLAALARRPEVTVWEIGHSYQGRPGHVVDVHLPIADSHTHYSRLKLGLQKPTCFIIARHHANEVSSTTAALGLIEELADDAAMRAWLHRLNLVFLPMANPDGAATHYRLMSEHPRWKHHAARFNAAGMEISIDTHNPDTPFGEARFRRETWLRWLPDAMVDNHGVPSHEWCQPFAGYNSPPRFPVSYHVVQAMIYGIITYADDPAHPELRKAAESLRAAVARAVSADPELHERNQFWLDRYNDYGHRWLPEKSPMDVHDDMLFFFRGMDRRHDLVAWRSFSLRYPEITLVDWVTEVPDETAQGEHLLACAAAHRTANLAMMRLVADSAQPAVRSVRCKANGEVYVGFSRERRLEENPQITE